MISTTASGPAAGPSSACRCGAPAYRVDLERPDLPVASRAMLFGASGPRASGPKSQQRGHSRVAGRVDQPRVERPRVVLDEVDAAASSLPCVIPAEVEQFLAGPHVPVLIGQRRRLPAWPVDCEMLHACSGKIPRPAEAPRWYRHAMAVNVVWQTMDR